MMKKKTMMLPPVWKTVGLTAAAVILAAVLCFALIPQLGGQVDPGTRRMIAECGLSLNIISLFIAAMSRDKFEDEMLQQVRLTSIFYAFCWVTLYVAIYPLLVHFMRVSMINAQTAIFSMLLIYHINFNMSKLYVRRELDKNSDHEKE